jgi:hypothetical protein
MTIAAHAIDFTPRYAASIDDGIPFRRMYFSDGGRRIFYRPLPTWNRTGGAEGAVFEIRDIPRASVRLENAPQEHAQVALDETGLEVLRKFARSQIPRDATELVERWESVNPVILQGWTSYEIGFDYLRGGQRTCHSILFINLVGNRQICLIVEAAPAHFPPLYKSAHRTLATWWEPDLP